MFEIQGNAGVGNMESSNAPSVFSLTTIADEYEGVGHVSELALLQAASIHLNAVRTGLDPADPDASNPESLLSDEDIAFHLDQARSLYNQVLDRVSGSPELALFAINARFGLAAVAESSDDFDQAREQYALAASLATDAGFAPLAQVASEMEATAGQINPPALHEESDFPRLPFEPEPLESTIEVIDDTPAGPNAPEADPGDGGDAPTGQEPALSDPPSETPSGPSEPADPSDG